MVEFVPWYHSDAGLLRCLTCGALLVNGDAETHTEWHEKLEADR